MFFLLSFGIFFSSLGKWIDCCGALQRLNGCATDQLISSWSLLLTAMFFGFCDRIGATFVWNGPPINKNTDGNGGGGNNGNQYGVFRRQRRRRQRQQHRRHTTFFQWTRKQMIYVVTQAVTTSLIEQHWIYLKNCQNHSKFGELKKHFKWNYVPRVWFYYRSFSDTMNLLNASEKL